MSTLVATEGTHDLSAAHHGDEEHPPPFHSSTRIPWTIMGMLFFIGSETALFGSFFMAYFFIRVAQIGHFSSWAASWHHEFPLALATKNSLILFSSSVTIHWAGLALKRNARAWHQLWLGLTLVLGLTFFGFQVSEYGKLITDDKIGPSTSAFSSVFFSITGLHGSHVLIGALLLLVMFVRGFRGHYGPEPQQHVGWEAMSIYWHFVDIVWIFVFGLVYLPGNLSDFDWIYFAAGIPVLALLFFVPSRIWKPLHAHGAEPA